MPNPLLTRRVVVQAGLEKDAYNTEALSTDMAGILASDPTYTADPSVLERDFARDTLSPISHIIGRLMSKMEFTTELRGNGNTGFSAGTEPVIARLFQACGYSLMPKSGGISVVYETGDHATTVTWVPTITSTLAAALDDVIQYTFEVASTPAPTATTATLIVTSTGETVANKNITKGTTTTVGVKGINIVPTWSGTLKAKQSWTVWLKPIRHELKPISAAQKSITLHMNKDGVLHKMPGSFGTFEITATAGEYASVKWMFMGTYVDPVYGALPTASYERTLPAQVENSLLRVGDFPAVVEKFTFDQGNDVQIRPDVNSAQGYIGTRIVSREPEGGIDPEATLVADHDFWKNLSDARRMSFQMCVGHTSGNRVWMIAPSVQYTKTTYSDRQGILTYDAGLKFSGYNRDDELLLMFT